MITAPALTAPCPDWCIQPRGHGDRLASGYIRRLHVSAPIRVAGGGVVELEQPDTVTPAGAVVPDVAEALGPCSELAA